MLHINRSERLKHTTTHLRRVENMNRNEQIKVMIATLLESCDSVQVAACRHVGVKEKEKLIFKKNFNENLIAWLWYENLNNSANILVRPAPELDHPWLFIDDVPLNVAIKISAKYQCIVVETSRDNCQVRLLSSQNLPKEERTLIQRSLVEALGSSADAGSIAGCKWGRLVGFPNRKPGRSGFTTDLIALPDSTLPKFDVKPYLQAPTPSVFEGVLYVLNKQSSHNRVINKTKTTVTGKEDISGDDFGYILNRLRFFKKNGHDYLAEAKRLESELCHRTHKRNPLRYSQLTVSAVLKALNEN